MRLTKRIFTNWSDIFKLPLLLLLLPYIIIFFIFSFITDSISDKRVKKYWTLNKDKTFFFYSNKHGWHDFIFNNIVPVLPNDVTIANIYRDKPNAYFTILKIIGLNKFKNGNVRLPFLIKLSFPKVRVISFYQDFNENKKFAKRDQEIQQKIVTYIAEVIINEPTTES